MPYHSGQIVLLLMMRCSYQKKVCIGFHSMIQDVVCLWWEQAGSWDRAGRANTRL